ncbi:MAG: hypothetical protein D6812_04980 [Deltaproteobacteria bacterium]|nr:MAG: hypothetical protein D6812_04980 [Deltaproteobacteria bacterium]
MSPYLHSWPFRSISQPILVTLSLLSSLLAFDVPPLAAQVGAPIPQSDEEQARLRERIEESKAEAERDGLDLTGTLGANFSFNHNSNVVGQDDGSLVNLGLLFDAGLLFRRRSHELRGNLAVQHAQTRTSSIGRFVKSLDSLDLKALYLYHFSRPAWLSPFASGSMSTPLFRGYAVRAEDTRLQDVSATGEAIGAEETIPAKETIDLTDPLSPLVLKENAGFLATPIDTEKRHFEFGLGLGGLHVFARNGRVLTEEKDDPVVKRVALADSNQLGGVFQAAFKNQLRDAMLLTLRAELMYPFYTDADTSNIDLLLNTDLSAALRVTLGKFVSLDYIFSLKRIPLLLDEWQIQNGLLVNFAYELF